MKNIILISFLIVLLTACSAPATLPAPTPIPTNSATAVPPSETPSPVPPSPTPTETVMTYATLPDISAEGYAKSNLSTVLPNLAIYRDDKGMAQQVYDLETKQFMTPEAAGIHEVLLTDGTKWEMRYFSPNIPEDATPEEIERLQVQTLEKALQYIVDNDVLWDGRSDNGLGLSNPAWKEYFAKLKLIPNQVPLGGWALPLGREISWEDSFRIALKSVDDLSLIDFAPADSTEQREIICIDIPAEVVKMLLREPDKVKVPPKPQQ